MTSNTRTRLERCEQKTGSRAGPVIIAGLHERDYENDRLTSFMFRGKRYPIEQLPDFEVKYNARCIQVNWTDAAETGTWPDKKK